MYWQLCLYFRSCCRDTFLNTFYVTFLFGDMDLGGAGKGEGCVMQVKRRVAFQQVERGGGVKQVKGRIV